MLSLAVSALVTTSGSAIGQSDKPQVEIMHWWSSAGESAALDIFIDRFEARGGQVYDSAKNTQSANREEAIERMSKGYPPTLTQWNTGWDVMEFFEFGLIDAVTEPALVDKLKRTLPEPVLNSVTHNGRIIAMPLNIHSENWMWYSKALIQHDGGMRAANWDDFIATGKALREKNIPLLAVGDQSWQVRILFTSLMLGVSRDVYRQFYTTTELDTASRPAFKKTLQLFNRLAKYSRSFEDGNWNSQVKAVAENRAGATFMGDWAKGEFQVLGKTAGDEYSCALTGPDSSSLLLVIDAFILGKVTDPQERLGQALMLDVVSDPEASLAFNALKGSVSPYVTPAADQLDVCSAQVYDVLSDSEAVLQPYASYAHGAYMHQIDNTIYSFWQASVAGDVDDEVLIEQTVAQFNSILKQRKLESENPTLSNLEE